jgi:hypothetical protein
MSFQKLSWQTALTMLINDRSGDLIAFIFALIITTVVVALLPF